MRCCLNYFKADETLEITDSQAHGGTYSLCVSTRAKNWNGPQIALDDLISAGEEYVVTAYAKTTWYSTLTLSMQPQHLEEFQKLLKILVYHAAAVQTDRQECVLTAEQRHSACRTEH